MNVAIDVGCMNGFTDHHFSFFEVESNGDYRNIGSMGDVPETGPEFCYLLSSAFRSNGEYEVIGVFNNGRNLFNHVMTFTAFHRDPAKHSKEPTVGGVEQLTLTQKFSAGYFQDASGCHANDKIQVAGVRCYTTDVLLLRRKVSIDLPSKDPEA